MIKFRAVLVPGQSYHVFNRAVGSEQLFLSEKNYHFFLSRFLHYLGEITEGFCYCLLPNHFHFFFRFASQNCISNYMEEQGYCPQSEDHSLFLLQQFSNFFNSYTKSINTETGRKGKLFMEPFCRRTVEDHLYFTKLIHYIHANPVHHGYCQHVADWPYSSYRSLICGRNTWLQSKEVIALLGSIAAFEEFHHQPIQLKTKCR